MKNGRINVVSLFVLAVALLTTASISWAAGGYQYNLTCSGCHGMPPLDDATRNPVTGGFTGKHSTHMGASAAAAKCDICHFDAAVVPVQTKPTTFASDHSNGKIQMFTKYNKGTFFNQTSVPLTTNATCATVNCHFEAPATPNWLTNLPAADCNTCHASPPTAPLSTKGSDVSHTTHYSNVAAWGSPFGTQFCVGCHNDGSTVLAADATGTTGRTNFNGTATTSFQHATSVTNRGVHIDANINYNGNGLNFLPSQAASRVLGTCNTTYCHSNGVQGAGNVKVASPVWGTNATCASCHAATPATGAHTLHAVTKAYGCALCHINTTANGTTISNVANHTNKIVDVAFSGLAGTGTGVASCSTTYCHAGSTLAPPVWGTPGSVTCGSCHKADNATLASPAHPAHLNPTVLYGPTALQALPGGTAATSCKTCHTVYPANHANGLPVDVTLTTCNPCHVGTLTTTIWKAGRVTCESCHTGATRSVIQTVTAPDESLSATKGHTQSTFTGALTCNSCHNQNSAHISGVLGDNVRLTLANTNAQCASCHNAAAAVKPAFRNMSTHFTALGVANELCKTCHNPHGTTNLSMIRTQLKGPWSNVTTWTITYTDPINGFINTTNNRGLCQVCHTKTKYYLAGKVESSHPTSACLDCHGHNAKGGAFKPSGTCDGCHGYPPVPRGYAIAGVDFGVAGKFASARFEDYTGGGGAHAIAAHVNPTAVPADGWKNCAGCHNSGITGSTPNHKTIMPIKTNIANVTIALDPAKKFNATKLMNYSGAKLVYPGNVTGSCTNVECHFKPSPKWSIVR